MNKEQLKEKLAEQQKMKEQQIADLNATIGAINMLKHLIDEAEKEVPKTEE